MIHKSTDVIIRFMLALLGAALAASANAVPTITPGSTPVGSWAATAVPGVQGTGDTTDVVMAWDMVKRQPLTATDNRVCVIAFHKPNATEYGNGVRNAMNKVTFIEDNGTAVDVPIAQTTTVNRTGGVVSEFCVDSTLSGLGTNQPTEFRAIGYPTNGQPVVLQGDDTNIYNNYTSSSIKGRFSFFAQANYSPTRYYVGGTGASDSNSCTDSTHPCASIQGAKAKITSNFQNQEVCLQEGKYNLNSTSNTTFRAVTDGWWTITTCPGAAKANTIINSWGASNVNGAYVQLTRLKNLTITNPKLVNADGSVTTNNGYWLDNVDWINQAALCLNVGTTCDYPFFANQGKINGGIFATDTKFSNFNNAPNKAALERNVTVDSINSDSFQNVFVVINATVKNVLYCCSAHPDLNQMSDIGTIYNHIIAYVTATVNVSQQGPFQSMGGALYNAWYDHITFDGSGGTPSWNVMNMSNGTENINMTNMSLTGDLAVVAGGGSDAYFADNVCTKGGSGMGTPTGWTIRNSATCQ